MDLLSPILTQYLKFASRDCEKNTKIISQNRRYTGLNSKLRSPENDSELLNTTL